MTCCVVKDAWYTKAIDFAKSLPGKVPRRLKMTIVPFFIVLNILKDCFLLLKVWHAVGGWTYIWTRPESLPSVVSILQLIFITDDEL